MATNAFWITTLLMLALVIGLLQACTFLSPYRSLLIQRYGSAIALYAGALFVNLFAAVYATSRAFFLKDTGRKLAHLEKQLRTGASISDELSRRLQE